MGDFYSLYFALLYHLIFLLLHIMSVIKKKLKSIYSLKKENGHVYTFLLQQSNFLIFAWEQGQAHSSLNSLNAALSLEPSSPSYLVNWIEMLHSLWFPTIPIAWPAVSWESFRAFSVNVHFLNYCSPPSFSSSVKNQRWGET